MAETALLTTATTHETFAMDAVAPQWRVNKDEWERSLFDRSFIFYCVVQV